MGSPTESILLAIAPKFTAFLSLCGSLGIILNVLRSPRRRKKTMQRIMLGMSISDQLASIWYFAGTWVIPAGTLSGFGNGTTDTIFWAAGDRNGISCSVGGFFNQLAVCTPLYNASLAFYYLLTVYFGWDDHRISKISWTFHVLPWSYALFTSIFAAATNLYGQVEWTCWILPGEVFDENKDPSPIQEKFRMIQWIFLFGVVWACAVFVSVVFVALYRKMKHLEKKMKVYLSAYTGYTCPNAAAPKISEHTTEHQSEDDCHESSDDNDDGSIQSDDGSIEDDEVTDVECGVELFKKAEISGPKMVRAQLQLSTINEDERKPESTTNVKANGKTSSGDKDSFEEHGNPSDKPSKTVGLSFGITWLASLNKPVSGFSSRIISTSKGIKQKRGEEKCRKEKSPEYILKKKFKKNSKSRKICRQGMLYVAAFYITWLFPTITRITDIVAGKNYFGIQFFDTLLVPIQGFLNFCIYIRPRLMIYRKKNPELGFWVCLKDTLLDTD